MTEAKQDPNLTNPAILDPAAQKVDQLARDVLRDAYQRLELTRLEMVETDVVVVRADLRVMSAAPAADGAIPQICKVEGNGVGLVDAFFDGMMRQFATEHRSLKAISIADFAVRPSFDSARGRRSDAAALATLVVTNSEGARFTFERATPSVTRSSVLVALDALLFFINSERAYVQLKLALGDAEQRKRSDLVERYRTQLATLVTATSYSEVAERLREP